jgi:arylsulfatase A-like enzyme
VLQTPNLDKIADMGARVEKAFVSCPLCVPSRCSIMTGRYPSVTRSHSNATLLGTDEEDLAKILRVNGYRLALAGKNHCFRPDSLATWDFVYEEDHIGPRNHPDEERLSAFTQDLSEVYHRHAVSSAALPYPKEDFGTYRITEQALRFLWHASDAADPFFL